MSKSVNQRCYELARNYTPSLEEVFFKEIQVISAFCVHISQFIKI